MNKAELIIELGNIKSEIMNANLTALPAKIEFIELMEEKLDKVVLDLIDEEDKYNTCDCQECPAMNKMNNLADVINQGYMVSERIGQPFKVECIESELKTVKKVVDSYGIGFHIGIEEAEKMARGGTD